MSGPSPGPRRFRLKEKALAMAPSFRIADESGEDRYVVTSKALTLVEGIKLLDLEGREVAEIRASRMGRGAGYQIVRDGQPVAAIGRKAMSLRPRYVVVVGDSERIDISGSFRAHEFVFKRGENVIARASRKVLAVSDNFGVEVDDEADEVLILASVIAISRMLATERSR